MTIIQSEGNYLCGNKLHCCPRATRCILRGNLLIRSRETNERDAETALRLWIRGNLAKRRRVGFSTGGYIRCALTMYYREYALPVYMNAFADPYTPAGGKIRPIFQPRVFHPLPPLPAAIHLTGSPCITRRGISIILKFRGVSRQYHAAVICYNNYKEY